MKSLAWRALAHGAHGIPTHLPVTPSCTKDEDTGRESLFRSILLFSASMLITLSLVLDDS